MTIELRHLRYFWCEHVAAGHGIGLCPASAATFHGRPGVCFVPSAGLPPATMCVAWRAGDTRPAVQNFISLASSEFRLSAE
jgi:DNA-binding transcriptional LysR family regulator